MTRAIGGALVAALIGLAIFTPRAASLSQGPRFQLTTRLLPSEVVGRTPRVDPLARGAFSAVVNAGWRRGQTISPRVKYSRTTGVIHIHIHAGAPGMNGPVLYTVCSPAGPVPCRLPVRFFNWSSFPWVPDVVHRSAYVDVHTTRNPHGELRVQLTVRQLP